VPEPATGTTAAESLQDPVIDLTGDDDDAAVVVSVEGGGQSDRGQHSTAQHSTAQYLGLQWQQVL
jgi:hypothetical protein